LFGAPAEVHEKVSQVVFSLNVEEGDLTIAN
jgi:hypothetical protein